MKFPEMNKRVGRPFVWRSLDLKGNPVDEFTWDASNVLGYRETSFNDLDKSKVAEFWLEGPIRLGFSALTGVFFIEGACGNRAELEAKLGRIPLTRPSNDIIQFKDVEELRNLSTGAPAGGGLVAHRCGYKWTEGKRSFQIIGRIVKLAYIEFTFRIVWDKDYEGDLVINGVKNPVKLKKGVASTFPLLIRMEESVDSK